MGFVHCIQSTCSQSLEELRLFSSRHVALGCPLLGIQKWCSHLQLVYALQVFLWRKEVWVLPILPLLQQRHLPLQCPLSPHSWSKITGQVSELMSETLINRVQENDDHSRSSLFRKVTLPFLFCYSLLRNGFSSLNFFRYCKANMVLITLNQWRKGKERLGS